MGRRDEAGQSRAVQEGRMIPRGYKNSTVKTANKKRPLNHRLANGEPGGARTRDHRIKSAMLYQLSYRPDGEGKR